MIGLKPSRHFFIQSQEKTKLTRASLASVFPRFASATCVFLAFWLVERIASVLCLFLGDISAYALVFNPSWNKVYYYYYCVIGQRELR